MAIRLEKTGWSNADHWLRLQTAYDLAQACLRERDIKVHRYVPRTALWRRPVDDARRFAANIGLSRNHRVV